MLISSHVVFYSSFAASLAVKMLPWTATRIFPFWCRCDCACVRMLFIIFSLIRVRQHYASLFVMHAGRGWAGGRAITPGGRHHTMMSAAKGTIKIRQAMKLVGFTEDEIHNMTLYQRVRHQSMRLSVVDTRVVSTIKAVALPLSQVDVGSGDTVTSTLSSAERTGENASTTLDTRVTTSTQLLQQAQGQIWYKHIDFLDTFFV